MNHVPAVGAEGGERRKFMVIALGKMSNPQAVDVLLDLLGVEAVAPFAISALGKLQARRATTGDALLRFHWWFDFDTRLP